MKNEDLATKLRTLEVVVAEISEALEFFRGLFGRHVHATDGTVIHDEPKDEG